MITDPFNTADNFHKTANIEAWSRYPKSEGEGQGLRLGFKEGAEWGHAQALTQEPTDAEVMAAMTAYEGHPDRVTAWRAALSAVLSIRRNEETR